MINITVTESVGLKSEVVFLFDDEGRVQFKNDFFTLTQVKNWLNSAILVIDKWQKE